MGSLRVKKYKFNLHRQDWAYTEYLNDIDKKVNMYN